jgi:undecaprenyl diphosphate synthase
VAAQRQANSRSKQRQVRAKSTPGRDQSDLLYAFSTENWKRPRYEVDALMRMPEKIAH